jgi:hypothetical protein
VHVQAPADPDRRRRLIPRLWAKTPNKELPAGLEGQGDAVRMSFDGGEYL